MHIFDRIGQLKRALAGTLVVALAASMLAACGTPVSGEADYPIVEDRVIHVVATTGQVGDAVANVGGERVDVYAMMGPGIDPHLYKPTPEDVNEIVRADIIFYNGLHLEGRMSDLFERLATQKPTVGVAEVIPEDQLTKPPEFEGNFDPHVWFDPALWKFAVNEIIDALSEIDPAHADGYQQRGASYLSQIEDLEEYAAGRLAEVPESSRVLVTAHDAFGYFGIRWGYEVRGLQGLSTTSEAGVGDVQSLADFLIEREIKAIFIETSIPQATIDAVIQAVRARGGQIEIGGALYSDALGDADSPEGTYLGMYRHNIDTIVEALK